MLSRVLSGLLNRRILRFLSVFVFVMALVTAVGAIAATVTDLNLRAHGVTTDATIINVNVNVSRDYSQSSKSYTTTYNYTDLISYKTADGSPHQASIGGSSSQHAGETIAVVYDPSHPGTVQPKSSLTGTWWIALAIFLLIALGLGWLGTYLWRRGSRVGETLVEQSAV